MRALKLCMVLGLILAVSGAAVAVPIGSNPPWAGDFVAHISNWEISRIYTGYLADGTTLATTNQAYTDPVNELEWVDASGKLEQDESSYGVFRIDQVLRGEKTGTNAISPVELGPNQTIEIWNPQDAGMEIVGIFYGRTDTRVLFDDDDGTYADATVSIQKIRSTGDTYDIYYQPLGTMGAFYPATSGVPTTAGRLALDQQLGVGYSALNTTIGASEFVLRGGTVQTGGQPAQIVVEYNPNSVTGVFDTYLSLETGYPWNETDSPDPLYPDFQLTFPFDKFFNPGPGPLVAHLRLHTTLSEYSGPAGWFGTSSDPLTGSVVIPEPITMLSAFFGIAGVAGYIRKRRMG